MRRAATAGNSALRSGVSVNRQLTRSPVSSPLRPSSSCISASVASRIASASLAATVLAPRNAISRMWRERVTSPKANARNELFAWQAKSCSWTSANSRRRRSSKWVAHPPDVLPVFVAEMDVALAPPVRAALAEAIELGDTGYAEPGRLVRGLRRVRAAPLRLDAGPGAHALDAGRDGGNRRAAARADRAGRRRRRLPAGLPARSSTASRRRAAASSRSRSSDGELDLDGLERVLRGRRAGAAALQPAQPDRPRARPRDARSARRARRPARRRSCSPTRSTRRSRCRARATRRSRARRDALRGDHLGVEGVQPRRAEVRARGRGLGRGRPQSCARCPEEVRYRAGLLGVIASEAAFDARRRLARRAAGRARRQPRAARRAARRAPAGDRLRPAGRELPRLAGLPRARPRRRPRGDVPRARSRGARAGHRASARRDVASRGSTSATSAALLDDAVRPDGRCGRDAARRSCSTSAALSRRWRPSGRSPSRSGPNAIRSSAHDAVPDRLEHAPHLPLAPLVDDDLHAVRREPPRARPARSCRRRARRLRAAAAAPAPAPARCGPARGRRAGPRTTDA